MREDADTNKGREMEGEGEGAEGREGGGQEESGRDGRRKRKMKKHRKRGSEVLLSSSGSGPPRLSSLNPLLLLESSRPPRDLVLICWRVNLLSFRSAKMKKKSCCLLRGRGRSFAVLAFVFGVILVFYS